MKPPEKHSIEVTTKIGCSNVCEYCPQSTLISRYRERIGKEQDTMMSLETYKKCISTMPNDKIQLNFTGYVEPFLNPDCADMLIHTHKMGFELLVNTTLMGLTKEQWDRMSEIPYDCNVHLPSGSYFEMIGVKIPLQYYEEGGKKYPELTDEYYDILNYILENPNKWSINFHCHGDLHPLLNDLARHYNVGVRDINSRAMNLLLEKTQKVPPEQNIRGKCPRVYQNVLLPDGSLALCCQDYGLDEIMGNLKENTWEEYINSEHVQDIRNNGADLCDYCEEEIDYRGEEKWAEWRKPQQIR